MNHEVVYRGQGCEQCGFTGYESRKGIFELMEPRR